MAEQNRRANVTSEVGSEGGSPGDVQVTDDRVPATGSEATTTWRPAKEKKEELRGSRGSRDPREIDAL